MHRWANRNLAHNTQISRPHVGCGRSELEVAAAERVIKQVKTVGPWRLRDLLGMGGMANVYSAGHREVCTLPALCILRVDSMAVQALVRTSSARENCTVDELNLTTLLISGGKFCFALLSRVCV